MVEEVKKRGRPAKSEPLQENTGEEYRRPERDFPQDSSLTIITLDEALNAVAKLEKEQDGKKANGSSRVKKALHYIYGNHDVIGFFERKSIVYFICK